jgi:hypothetical protein
MTKTLRVINPFFTMESGDLFEYETESKMYVAKRKEEFYKMEDSEVNEIKSSYSYEFKISAEYAESLIEDGYLEEVSEDEKTNFVNVFDEIDRLTSKYKGALKTINEDCAKLPACVKVEKEAVLTNMITLLEHLKSLKK